MTDSITLPLPPNTTILLQAITNSGGWTQLITIQPNNQASWQYVGTGNQNNQIVGGTSVGPSADLNAVTVTMQYDAGQGAQPSDVRAWVYDQPGLSGYIIGGQDGGGRPSGPAYHNTMVLIYWSVGY